MEEKLMNCTKLLTLAIAVGAGEPCVVSRADAQGDKLKGAGVNNNDSRPL
jgi:hypothetical protein